jgi:hypothetical protein
LTTGIYGFQGSKISIFVLMINRYSKIVKNQFGELHAADTKEIQTESSVQT